MKIHLVKDAIGGLTLQLENGDKFSNLFVKKVTKQEGKVVHLDAELIYIMSEGEVKNW